MLHRIAAPLVSPARLSAGKPGLILLHRNVDRLVALAAILEAEGYQVSGACSEQSARLALDRLPAPPVLITSLGGGTARWEQSPLPGLVFGRECIAARPGTRAVYLTPLPWPSSIPLVAGERLLRVPFTSIDLAGALAAPLSASPLPPGQPSTPPP